MNKNIEQINIVKSILQQRYITPFNMIKIARNGKIGYRTNVEGFFKTLGRHTARLNRHLLCLYLDELTKGEN